MMHTKHHIITRNHPSSFPVVHQSVKSNQIKSNQSALQKLRKPEDTSADNEISFRISTPTIRDPEKCERVRPAQIGAKTYHIKPYR